MIKKSEKIIQKTVCDYAREKGYGVIKPDPSLYNGIPDRQFIKDGKMFFIEFKATGKKPSKHQLRAHREMEAYGFKVYVIDNIEEGKGIFNVIN